MAWLTVGIPADLVPSLCEDLLASVDQPLKIAKDAEEGHDYLLCDYNRDGDSYRSPWSNKYNPPLADGAVPAEKLRKARRSGAAERVRAHVGATPPGCAPTGERAAASWRLKRIASLIRTAKCTLRAASRVSTCGS